MSEQEQKQYASIDDIVNASKRPRRYRDVTLPVSGLTVKIQSLSEKEKSELETEAMSKSGDSLVKQRVIDARRRLIMKCLVEPKLERHHLEMLGDFDGADLGYLHSECAEHIGWSKSDLDKLEGN